MSDVEQAISVDPALTASLLKLANSACFGLRREVKSVREAATLVGTKQIFELALGAAFSKVLPQQLPGYELNAWEFWRHSVAVAVLTEQLSREQGVRGTTGGFSMGLLHDLGKLVIGAFLAENAEEVLSRLQRRHRSLSFVDVERQVLGIDHCLMGERLAEVWQLPAEFGAVARYHHSPIDAPPEVQGIADLTHVADGLAHLMGYGEDIGELARVMNGEVLERLGLSTRPIERAMSLAHEQIQQLEKIVLDPVKRGAR
jgi:HD-like signal output (HDOD) protein